MAGQLSAFTRLRALGDFDLELVGRNKIFGSHAEAGGRDLLDSAVCEIAARQAFESAIVFAAFSVLYLKEPFTLNYAVGFALIAAGAYFVFRGPF